MRIHYLKENEVAYRPKWLSRGLFIIRHKGVLCYNDKGNIKPLRVGSSSFDYTDFIFKTYKENEMQELDYKEVKVVVLNSKGVTSTYVNEAEALEYIQDQLENNPKLRFKMFELYQTVEPKRIDISSLISKVLR